MTDPAHTTLLALIEAGQRAHRVLLRPLIERGLEAGDDAVLLLLLVDGVVSEAHLEDGTGLTIEALQPRLDRLAGRDVVVRIAAGYALTERGARLRQQLLAVWSETDQALTGGLKEKHRRRLEQVLAAFGDRLRLPRDPG